MCVVISALLFAAWYENSSNASGMWEGAFDTTDGSFDVTFELEQDRDGQLSGMVSLDGGQPLPISGGQASGIWMLGNGEFEIFVDSPVVFDSRALVFEGDLAGGQMTGSASLGDESTSFTAERVGSAGSAEDPGESGNGDAPAEALAAGDDRHGA